MVRSTPKYITPLTLTLTIIPLLLLISNTTSTPPPAPHNLTTNYPQEPPIYTLTKLSYSNLTKSQSTNLQHCALQHNTNYQLIPSINIHEGDSVSYPAIIRYCDQFYTINGYHLVSFSACAHPTCRYFVSSVRNQFTYFVQVESRQPESPNTTATIRRLQSRNKKVLIQTQTTIQIPTLYGSITSFANSFSLSLKLYAFATSKHYVLFYRADGTLQSCISLGSHHMPLFAYPQHMQPQPSYSEINIVKLNNHLAIYTVELNKDSFIYTMSTNGKNSTLKKYTLPKVEPQQTDRIQIKFNDNHWNQFYLKVQNRVYVYDQTDKLNGILPKLWYPLLHHQDQFYIAGSMLIVVSHLGKHQHQHEPVRIYYNLTSNSVAQFFIPDIFCPHNTHIRTSSQGHTSQILCTFCKYSFQCYSLFSNADPNSISKTDYTDYSKFRVPLVLISLGVVIFISVTRGKKKDIKSLNEEKEQQMFMKELERKDKTLYEQLKKTRKVPAQSPAKRNRGVQDTSQLE